MKKTLLCLGLYLSLFSYACATEMNAGFVEGIWYASSRVFADQSTRIYVAFRNNTEHDLTGTIRFADNEERIGTSYITALPGRLVEGWTDWTPKAGSHKITATLSDVKLHAVGEGAKSAEIESVSLEHTLLVDYDTDKDGEGDTDDLDDDNDEVSDEDERARGTDPKVANPKDTDQTQTLESEPTSAPQKEVPKTAHTAAGLETYIGEGRMHNVMVHTTEQIVDAKARIDAYRDKRNNERIEKAAATLTLNEKQNTATITRSRIETDGGFPESFLYGIGKFGEHVWTFVLYAASKFLAHPALLQVFFLLGLLYSLYSIMRRIARRPN